MALRFFSPTHLPETFSEPHPEILNNLFKQLPFTPYILCIF